MRASEEAVALPRQLQGLSQETVMLGPLCPSLLWYESHHLPTQVRKDTGLLCPTLLIVLSDGSRRLLRVWLSTVPCRSPRHQPEKEVLWAPAGLAPWGLKQASISGTRAETWTPPGLQT